MHSTTAAKRALVSVARREQTDVTSELEARISHDFAEDIAGKLKEATIIAQTLSGFGAQGFPDRAVRTLLDIETFIHHAATLLNAASVVRRRDQDRADT